MSEVNNELEVQEDKFLRVKGDTNVKKLASAITHELNKENHVSLRAIGVQAVSQACKAIAIAGSFIGQNGCSIDTRIGFVTLEGEKRISAMVYHCKKVK